MPVERSFMVENSSLKKANLTIKTSLRSPSKTKPKKSPQKGPLSPNSLYRVATLQYYKDAPPMNLHNQVKASPRSLAIMKSAGTNQESFLERTNSRNAKIAADIESMRSRIENQQNKELHFAPEINSVGNLSFEYVELI